MPSILRLFRRDDDDFDFDDDDDGRCARGADGKTYCYSFWYTEVRPQLLFPGPMARARKQANSQVQKGVIIKWTIVSLIFAFFLAWFIGGYWHARRRMKAGKPLLAYHRVRYSFFLLLLPFILFVHFLSRFFLTPARLLALLA
jgi:heme/copper-type cytochrome/quinol oxidase subunit 2